MQAIRQNCFIALKAIVPLNCIEWYFGSLAYDRLLNLRKLETKNVTFESVKNLNFVGNFNTFDNKLRMIIELID